MWIAFEGPDRSGKTTQIKLAETWLASLGIPFLSVQDPSPDIASGIRQILLHSTHHPTTEFLLFMAARSELYHKQILPFYQDHPEAVILGDRYLLSTAVYQRCVPLSVQQFVHEKLGLTLHPDAYLVFLPDSPFAGENNLRDRLSVGEYRALYSWYKYIATDCAHCFPSSIYLHEFESRQSPDEIFDRFTRPHLLDILSRRVQK